jgi:diadenosine tetraphosphatase ApaH/serine/threonine PP2A family protein phosphatase
MLQEGIRYLVNPGSVGQPRDGDPRAGFAVYDSADKSITFFRVPYDVQKAQHRIIAAGLPDRLASRLTDGR